MAYGLGSVLVLVLVILLILYRIEISDHAAPGTGAAPLWTTEKPRGSRAFARRAEAYGIRTKLLISGFLVRGSTEVCTTRSRVGRN
jgi:hypothetical protein